MDTLNEQQQDKLKDFHLLEEVRRLGQEIDEPIQFKYLIKDGKLSDEKTSIPLSEINDTNLLTHLKPKHKALIPVLLKYLHEFKTRNYKELVVMALGVKGFYDATEALINEFNTTSLDNLYKWSIGNAFSIIMDKRYEDQYIDIIKEKKHGSARGMVIRTLGTLKSEKSLPILLNLLDDEELCGHVLVALGHYKKSELIKYIEPFLNHKKSWIRNQAKRATEKIKKTR